MTGVLFGLAEYDISMVTKPLVIPMATNNDTCAGFSNVHFIFVINNINMNKIQHSVVTIITIKYNDGYNVTKIGTMIFFVDPIIMTLIINDISLKIETDSII